jgi:cell division cycle 2-like protein
MASKGKSRWADDEEDAAIEAQRKREKEEKKRAKAEKQRKLEEAAELQRRQREAADAAEAAEAQAEQQDLSTRPSKRRRLSPEPAAPSANLVPARLLRFPAPEWKQCRSVEDFDKLNDIEEGAYGWVSRAKDTATGKVVALKRLKMDNAQDGIPVTGLREIQTLMDCDHPNIVKLQEVVVGDDTSKIEQ